MALAVLLINDHVLKPNWPGPVSGKLSDVAGLVVAPPLLALVATLVAPRLPARPAAAGAVTATGLGFIWVKTTASGAASASAAWSVVSGPSRVLADPADLMALPALGLAWWAFTLSLRHRVPGRLVSFVRVVVVVPIAVLAVAADSPGYHPFADVAVVRDGVILVQTGNRHESGGVASADGVTWRDATVQEFERIPGVGMLSSCVPGSPRHCYRVLGDRPRAEETLDGGTTWKVSWEIPSDRLDFLRRAYWETSIVEARSVTTLRTAGGHVVVVADGRDGVVVRRADGEWWRIGFPTPRSAQDSNGAPGRPPALVEHGARISREYILVGLAAVLAMGLGAIVSRRGAMTGMYATSALVPLVPLLPALGFAGVMLGEFVYVTPGVLAVGALGWLAGVVRVGGLDAWRGWTFVALGWATVLVSIRPMLAWTTGETDFGTANGWMLVRLASGVVLILAAGFAMSFVPERRVLRSGTSV